jgi:hypothetical protein
MRAATQTLLDLLAAGKLGKRNMFRVDISPNSYGFWDDAYDVVHESVTYSAIPGAMNLENITYNDDLSIRDVKVMLSPMVPIVITQIQNLPYHRKPAYIYYAYINLNTQKVVDTQRMFAGIIGNGRYRKQVNGLASIELSLISYNWELNTPGTRVRASNDQRQIVPTDGGYDFVSSAVTTPLWWGRDGPQRPTR